MINNKSALHGHTRFKSNDDSLGQTKSSDETPNVKNKNRIVKPCLDPVTYRKQGDHDQVLKKIEDGFIYIGPIRDEEDEGSVGPYFMSDGMNAINSLFRGFFAWKYNKNRDNVNAILLRHLIIHNITDADVDRILKGERKPHCTRCQYCFFLTCLTGCGGLMPPTPSPYSSPNCFESKWQNMVINPISTTLTELQYNSLYRDFKHASKLELRAPAYEDTRCPAFDERIDKLGGLVEEEMLKITHTFTSEVFTTLVEEYLKLFEEMVKGLILLKETGITLEDICSMGEESHVYDFQQTTLTTNEDSKLSSGQPYKAAEFEKVLLNELVMQYEAFNERARKIPRDNNAIRFEDFPICTSKESPAYQNPYLSFLIYCHTLPSCDTEEFGQILHVEKQMFLKDCLKLLRDNDYFRFHSQSSSESEKLNTVIAECSSHKNSNQQDINEDEMYKMSIRIYNKTICHVQSAILAICRSMRYGKEGRQRLLPPTPDRTSNFERGLKVSESKNLIKKSLSDYLKPTDRSASSEDEVFINEHRDSTLQDNTAIQQHKKHDEGIESMPSVKYENEIKRPSGEYEYGLKYKNIQRSYLQNEDRKHEFLPLREIMRQHPDLEYADDRRQSYKVHSMIQNTQDAPKTNVAQNTMKTGFSPVKIHDNEDKIVLLAPNQHETGTCILDKPLFKRKKNDVRIICGLNYYETEISHLDAIAFLHKMELEGGILHYPHCSENTSLTKMDGPSFFLSVCCADCSQQLAPPQKLEAFKSEPVNTSRSKLMSHFIRKSSASYFPVRCGSCSYFLCDPEKLKKQHLLVPFHSSAKGIICASRLKSHECETGVSDKVYTGCLSDAINTFNTQNIKKIIKEGTKRCQPHNFLNKLSNHRIMPRSLSLPILVQRKDHVGDITENYNNKYCVNASLKFEDAVTNILNMWTYEMIDYEKGAKSPHLRSQILNYRKSLSIFIKRDIREKLYYRHILSVFKRVENYESPILEFKDHVTNQKSKIIRRSRSCHSKLAYEAVSPTRRSYYKSLQCESYILNTSPKKVVEGPYLRPESRKNIARPLSLHSELKVKSPATQRRRRSCSFTESVYKEDFSNQMNAWKNELQKLQKGIDSPDIRSQGMNRRNIARPHSLHSELKHKTLPTPGRRRSSCSFATESSYKDFSTQITVWKNELLKLQKSAESPHLGYEALNRNNMMRPLSLDSEIIQKPVIQRRRSFSLTESVYKKDLSTQINSWKNDLQELQKSVESPNLRCDAINSINYNRADSFHSDPKRRTTAATCRPKSESFINKFSVQINKSKQELIKLRQSLETINRNNVIKTRPNFLYGQKAAPHNQSESVVNKDPELTAWKHELLKMEKSVDSPQFKLKPLNRKVNIRAGSLDSEPKPTTSAVVHRSTSEMDDTVTELRTWNYKLRELERDATSPYRPKIKIRAHSLHTEPERATNLSRNRPKSESVLDDYSTELETWKHKLLTLEEDARNPQPETMNRKHMSKSRTSNSESKYNYEVAHRINCESMGNKNDIARRKVTIGPIYKPSEPIINTRISSQKSAVRRYSSTPRQLPATPDTRNVRRHSHYETTGNFVNLISDRRTTRLGTHTNDSSASTSNYGSADPGSIHPRNGETDGFLRPDEGATRARFLSQ